VPQQKSGWSWPDHAVHRTAVQQLPALRSVIK
jgi:hypothetical protein